MYLIQYCILFVYIVVSSGQGNSSDITSVASKLPRTVTCRFQSNTNICDNTKSPVTRYYYDAHVGECRSFEFGHCPDNGNVFESIKECKDMCQDAVNDPMPEDLPQLAICHLQSEFGTCHKYFPSYYYDPTNDKCKGFSYSGCDGNANRFKEAIDCISTCGRGNQ